MTRSLLRRPTKSAQSVGMIALAGTAGLASLFPAAQAQGQTTNVGKNFSVDPTTGAAIFFVNGQQIGVPAGQFSIQPTGELLVNSAYLPGAETAQLAPAPLPEVEEPTMFDGLMGMIGFGGKARESGAESTVNAPVYAGDPNESDGIFGISQNTLLIGAAVIGGAALLWYANEEGWFDFDDEDNEDNTDSDDTTNALTNGTDDLKGTDGDDSFTAAAANLSNDDKIDGLGGTDTVTIDYSDFGSSSTIKSVAGFSNIENIVLTGLDGPTLSNLGNGIKDITKGTVVEVDASINLTLNDIVTAQFVNYSSAGSSYSSQADTDKLVAIEYSGSGAYQLDMDSSNQGNAYSNMNFMTQSTNTAINILFKDTATGDVQFFGKNANVTLDLSDLGLQSSDFSTITSSPSTSMGSRIEFDTVNDVLYIDNDADGSFSAASDFSMIFDGLTADLSASDFTF